MYRSMVLALTLSIRDHFLPFRNSNQLLQIFSKLRPMDSLPIINKSYEAYKNIVSINDALEKRWRYSLGASLEPSSSEFAFGTLSAVDQISLRRPSAVATAVFALACFLHPTKGSIWLKREGRCALSICYLKTFFSCKVF